ncbi:acetolactate synthase large subunit [Lichenifustis flavocetrariae]|uniref:Acetolactate synthase large subunit n=1 Tax=Lichenifustis flavocetrariae TaxID=2949735 RepID=A0AA42CKG0_9HYPH|nr:acetolactate synthase large subunit [Lichenifustis flavocetrariae]MCW6510504.1 acetolactate synthase large subunit [Lichenifustis flavocetrariae]
MNGADHLCDGLLAQGVDICFANPGTSEMHFVAALDRRPAMRCILGLSEGVVTGAADGYGRMAERPAATLLHTGPGLANGLANLHNARRARTPIVNIVGDHAAYHLPFDALLTSDIESFAKPVSHWLHRITGPGDVTPSVEAAVQAASSLPGIATLILPADAAWGEPSSQGAAPHKRLPCKAAPAEGLVKQVAAAIRAAGAGRVGLLLGGAATRGSALAVAGRLAESHGVKLLGEVFVNRAERGHGRPQLARIPYPVDAALAALQDIDVLVLVAAAPPVAFFAYPNKPSRLVRPDCSTLTLAEPGQEIAAALLALEDELGRGSGQGVSKAHAEPAPAPPSGVLTEDAIAVLLAARLPDQAIVCDEALTSARRFFALTAEVAPHDYLMNTGGAIGIGIPLATGAAVACPNRKVIALQADGSGLYTVQGLWTQARENLDVVTIILANNAYAILQGEMHAVGVHQFGRNAARMLTLDAPRLDWVSLASGFGVEAARATTCERFLDLLDRALRQRGPFLIEAVI